MKHVGMEIGKQSRVHFGKLGVLVALVLAWCALASAQSWTPITAPFPGSAGTALLRTDGAVMVEDQNTGNWYKLVPDLTGSYQNGSWFLVKTQPPAYNPLYFASAVLPDDRIVVGGGEYNFGVKDETNLGFIFDENGGTWSPINPPSGWSRIGDAQSVVLPNGTLMLGNCCSTEQALLDAKTLTWTIVNGVGKADSNSEEGWTLLPNGKVLTIDSNNGTNTELYTPSPSPGTWSSAGHTPSSLVTCGGELGPAVLRPDGTVFAAGANGKTAIYNSKTGKWSAGPTFPKNSLGIQLGVVDGPAALAPNGHVIIGAGPISPCYTTKKGGEEFFEFNGSVLNPIVGPPNAVNDQTYFTRMVVLPTGHILFTDGSSDVEVLIPTGSAKSSWAPAITSSPSSVTRGKSSTLKGTQFNGLSQGAAYGDDAQSATNFPLVRMTDSLGNVYYARTNSFSTMGVATGAKVVSCRFIPPNAMAPGVATLVVVANGIESNTVTVTVF